MSHSFIYLSIYLSITVAEKAQRAAISENTCKEKKHQQIKKTSSLIWQQVLQIIFICLCCEHLQRVCCKIDEVVFLRSCFQVYITVSHKSYTYIYKSLENTVYYVYIVEMCILYIVYNCLLYIVQMCILCKCVYYYSCIL